MPLDFFIQANKNSSNKGLFGLCDDTTDENHKKPAYLDEKDKEKWIAEVHNRRCVNVDFFSLDCCVTWKLSNGNYANVCDGMLAYNNQQNIIFVELKNRNPEHKQWKIKAEKQLKSTI